VLSPGSLPAFTRSGDWRRCRGYGAWKIAGERSQLAPRGCLEYGIEAMVELLQSQPALGVVLAQASGHRIAVGICDALAGSGRHVILRILLNLPCC
jgi:hypothetical protein